MSIRHASAMTSQRRRHRRAVRLYNHQLRSYPWLLTPVHFADLPLRLRLKSVMTSENLDYSIVFEIKIF